MSELLAGVRVIESVTLFNGDTLGTILGDLGADVVQLERPFRALSWTTPPRTPSPVCVSRMTALRSNR